MQRRIWEIMDTANQISPADTLIMIIKGIGPDAPILRSSAVIITMFLPGNRLDQVTHHFLAGIQTIPLQEVVILQPVYANRMIVPKYGFFEDSEIIH